MTSICDDHEVVVVFHKNVYENDSLFLCNFCGGLIGFKEEYIMSKSNEECCDSVPMCMNCAGAIKRAYDMKIKR